MSTRRGIKTIIGSFFRKRGQMGAEASNATFFASVFFVAALAGFAISFILWWFPYHLFSDEVYNIDLMSQNSLLNSRLSSMRCLKTTETGTIISPTGRT